MPNGLCHLNSLDGPFPIKRDVRLVFIITMFHRISSIKSSVDPDQTLRSVASDLEQHCLLMYPLLDNRHKWVKMGCST